MPKFCCKCIKFDHNRQIADFKYMYKHKFVKSVNSITIFFTVITKMNYLVFKIGMSLCKALAALAYTRKDLTNQA